ncbi:hypothetical protein ACP4OV_020067 [Aristida adscensionis]
MASRGLAGYDYGAGAGGKVRRRPPSRAAAASPYARPAAASAPPPATAQPQGGGWLSRLVAAGASRLLPSLFRRTPPQLAAPPPPPPPPPSQEPLDARPPRWEPKLDLPPPRWELERDPVLSLPKPVDAPPSPHPPPLEDDLPENQQNSGAIANNLLTENPENSAKDGDEDMQRNSNDHGAMDLEELLKQRTFTRSEYEYLTELLWSRTVGSNSLKREDGNIWQKHVSEKENGLGRSNLPVDFSIRTYSIADEVASPAEVAKAYMGSKSSKGYPLRLRLHDPSTLPVKSMEANTVQKAKPPTIPLHGSRLHTSSFSDRVENISATPNRSAIYKMSSSPYFKSDVSSKDLMGSVSSSSYHNPGSVHTFGSNRYADAMSLREVLDIPRVDCGILKRKSTAINQETVSVGPIRKMRQRYNRTSPLLQTRPGCRGYLGSRGSKHDEDSEQSSHTQKRHCLEKVCDTALGSLDNKALANSFGQAPAQSTEMAAKILKQLDTLVPLQKENASELMQKHGHAMDVEDPISRKKEVSAVSKLLESSSSGVKEHVLLNGINGTAKFTPAVVAEANLDPTSSRPAALTSQLTSPKDSLQMDNCNGSIKIGSHQSKGETEKNQSFILEHTVKSSDATNKDKPPAFFLRSNAPANLVLSSDVGNQMSSSANGFTFPVPAVFGAQSQAPPTPTLSSPPKLPVEKQQPSVVSSSSGTPVETVPRIFKSVSEGLVVEKCEKKSNANDQLVSSKASGEVASFTCNPVFKFVNSKSTTLGNGVDHANGSTNSASKQSSLTGGSLTFSSTGTGSLPAASNMFASSAPTMASSGPGSVIAPFKFSPQFGTGSSLAAQDKSNAVSSSAPFTFSQQFSTTSSSTAQAQGAQSGSNSPFLQSSVSSFNVKTSEKSNFGSSQSFASSPVASSPFGSSPFSSSTLFSSGAGSGFTSVVSTAPPSPVTSSAFESSPALSSSSSIFGSKLTTAAPPSFGLPNTGSATSPFGSTSSPVFSFTSATPTVPSPSPTTPITGTTVPAVVSTPGTDQMNGGNMVADKNSSPTPFSSASPFGIPSGSPSSQAFGSPAQFASATPASPGVFQFGQHNQASSGGFSMGTGGGNDKSGRRILKVKRRK